MVKLTLYTCTDPANKIDKTLTTPVEIQGTYKNNQEEVRNPEILIRIKDNDSATYAQKNYAQIGSYYYFVQGYTQHTTGFVTLHLSLDVLKTYATQILASPAYVVRSASAYNLYYADPYLDLLGYKSPDATEPISPGSTSNFYLVAIGKLE